MHHTNPLVQADPSSVLHSSWVWTHRCFSWSIIQSFISIYFTISHHFWGAFKGAWTTPCKGQPLSAERVWRVRGASMKLISTDDISCPLPWTSEQSESSESSSLVTLQRQIQICLFAQDFLSCTHGYTRDSNFLGHTQMRRSSCGIKHVESSRISRVTGREHAALGQRAVQEGVTGKCREQDAWSCAMEMHARTSWKTLSRKRLSSRNCILHYQKLCRVTMKLLLYNQPLRVRSCVAKR